MTHDDILGSRPMDLDTEQRRREQRVQAGATFTGALIAALLLAVPLIWHLATVWSR